MALSNTTILYIVELAIYLILSPLIIYLAIRHGKTGMLGFFYLNIFATLRLVSDVIFISQRNNTTPSEAVAIVSSIGLSPLLLALSGLTHKVHVYLINATHTPIRAKQLSKWMWIAQILFHMAVAGGIAILTVGTTSLIKDQKPDSGASQSTINSDEHLREGGCVILFLVWLTMAAYASYLFRAVQRTESPVRGTLRVYALCILAGSAFVGVRAVYSVVYSFDHNDASLSPITGSFAVKLVLVVLAQLGAVVAWIVGAWIARNIKNEQHYYQPARGGSPSERVEMLPSSQGYGGPTGYKTGAVQV